MTPTKIRWSGLACSGDARHAGLGRAGGGRHHLALRVRHVPRRGLRGRHRRGHVGQDARNALSWRDRGAGWLAGPSCTRSCAGAAADRQPAGLRAADRVLPRPPAIRPGRGDRARGRVPPARRGPGALPASP